MRISAYLAASTLIFVLAAPAPFGQTASRPTTPADYNFISQAAYGGWGEVMGPTRAAAVGQSRGAPGGFNDGQ
jgi:hypothetical protein